MLPLSRRVLQLTFTVFMIANYTLASVEDATKFRRTISKLFAAFGTSKMTGSDYFSDTGFLVADANESRTNSSFRYNVRDNVTQANAPDFLPTLELSRDSNDINGDLTLNPRKKKEDGDMLIPFFIGFKATTLLIGVISLISLLTLKAFVASKTAILIAFIVGLKKLFASREKLHYEEPHYREAYYAILPENYRFTESSHESDVFKVATQIEDQKLQSIQESSTSEKDLIPDELRSPITEVETQIYEIHDPVSPEVLNAQSEFHASLPDYQEYKIDAHEKRRNWKYNEMRQKPLSLVIGSPHHAPPVSTYRKVVTGRNS